MSSTDAATNPRRRVGARRTVLIASAAVLLVALVAAVVTYANTRAGQRPQDGAAPEPGASASTLPGAASPTGSSTARPPQAMVACPLSGLEPTDSRVLRRPAMALKIDNAPEARPQPALNRADIVFEEPVEYHLTRLVPVFHCQGAARVGPVRGGRLVDRPLLQQLRSTVIMVHAGGITATRARIADAPFFFDVDVLLGSSRGAYRDPARFPPHDLFTNVNRLRQIHQVPGSPPQPLFSYSTEAPSSANTGTRVHVPYVGNTDVRWRYDRARHRYVRYDGSAPATSSGQLVTAANVIVQRVELVASRYVEDIGGAHEWIVHLVGSGESTVFRDGRAVPGRWIREQSSQPTRFVDRDGDPVAMRPGRTWWEIVPEDVQVTWH
jgi:Protein of unknown function (DUF3048) N-terminal domain/Protein of unknown function (DUF3048) C-terminal domain